MPAGGVRLLHAGKTLLRLIVLRTRVGSPSPRGVAGLRSIFRAIATACSERPPPGRMLAAELQDRCCCRSIARRAARVIIVVDAMIAMRPTASSA